MTFGRILKFIVVGLTLAGLALIGLIHFTEIATLKAVTLDDEPLLDWSNRFSLSHDKMLLQQPLDEMAKEIMSRKGVVKVDIDYILPSKLQIRTNEFTSLSLVVDKVSGVMRGVTAEGRVVKLSESFSDWDQPVMTNVLSGTLYRYCEDSRVRMVIPQLLKLEQENSSIYRDISEIDFGSSEMLQVKFASFPVRVKVIETEFYSQIVSFSNFMEQFTPPTDSTVAYDARFEGIVIRVAQDTIPDTTKESFAAFEIIDSIADSTVIVAAATIPAVSNAKITPTHAKKTSNKPISKTPKKKTNSRKTLEGNRG
ncbi:MAG: hypothetical protein SGI97_07145 [candidate division Zixibacteria bacterium]|nr:hypothetical protein [candidate division Zixibacteria bacterium]